MENQNNRSALFTARNTENSIIFFTIPGVLIIAVVFLDAKFLKKQEWWNAFNTILGSIPQVLASSTMLTIFNEGLDIVLTRWRESRAREKKRIQKAREEGYQAGYKAAKAGVEATGEADEVARSGHDENIVTDGSKADVVTHPHSHGKKTN